MSIKCSVYLASSIDGFIAGKDGDIQWLHRPEYAVEQLNGLGYEDFIATVDAIVMGRHTFEKVLTFSDWPYENVHVMVLSEKGLTIPFHLAEKVSIDSGNPDDIVRRLGSKGMKHLYIDGGKTVQRFLKAHRIDEITITQVPILIGGGISLFDSLGIEVPLKLIASSESKNGMVQVRYKVLRKV